MEIIHDEKGLRFYTILDGTEAYLTYVCENGVFEIQHTVVPEAISGRGVASALVEAACKHAETKDWMIRASCVYALAWLKRHPGYKYEEGESAGCCPL